MPSDLSIIKPINKYYDLIISLIDLILISNSKILNQKLFIYFNKYLFYLFTG